MGIRGDFFRFPPRLDHSRVYRRRGGYCVSLRGHADDPLSMLVENKRALPGLPARGVLCVPLASLDVRREETRAKQKERKGKKKKLDAVG
jgi:hypothetical protein